MSQPAMRSDSAIQQAVLQELKWDTRVKETEVGVQVGDGIVTLTGSVNSYGKRVAAEEAAHRVRGVLDVANELEVSLPGGPDLGDTEIAGAVRQALELNLLPDKSVTSTVSNGLVTLEGEVATIFERDECEKAIRNLAGVRDVRNRIEVKPGQADPDVVRVSLEDALERLADRQAERVEVAVVDGTVVLSGLVHSWQEKRAILSAVSHSPGVRLVDDRLRIDPHS